VFDFSQPFLWVYLTGHQRVRPRRSPDCVVPRWHVATRSTANRLGQRSNVSRIREAKCFRCVFCEDRQLRRDRRLHPGTTAFAITAGHFLRRRPDTRSSNVFVRRLWSFDDARDRWRWLRRHTSPVPQTFTLCTRNVPTFVKYTYRKNIDIRVCSSVLYCILTRTLDHLDPRLLLWVTASYALDRQFAKRLRLDDIVTTACRNAWKWRKKAKTKYDIMIIDK